MSRRNRPSAFDVSFPEEAGSSSAGPQDTYLQTDASRSSSVSSMGSRSSSNPLKRKSDSLDSKTVNPRIRPKAICYDTSKDQGLPEEIKDSVKFILPGEDADENEEDKPIRTLNRFTIYDPKHRNELILLSSLEEDDGVDREFVGVGYVLPYVFDEDEGQEDAVAPVRLKLGAILRFSMDYTKAKEPMYIETSCAWYILQDPSHIYRPFYDYFIFPHRIAQIAISWSIQNPRRSYDDFISYFTGLHGPSGRQFEENDIKAAQTVSVINEAVFDMPDGEGEKISYYMAMRQIRGRRNVSPSSKIARLPRSRPMPKKLSYLGQNPDLAVLKPENQNTTTVTPLIARLADGLVSEQLQVLSSRPSGDPHSELQDRMQKEQDALWKLIEFVHSAGKRSIEYKKTDRLAPGSNFLKAIEIDGVTYKVGDYILFHRGDWGSVKAPDLPRLKPEIPKDASIPDYFWFAKIVYIKQEESKIHVQWLEHGKQILLGELAHPQVLFLNDLCEDRNMREIVGKVTVYDRPKPEYKIKDGEYFYKFCHNQASFSFTSIDDELIQKANMMSPPDNCPICLLQSQQQQDMTDQELQDTFGTYGVSYAGKKYHLEDFVLIRSEGTAGPAHIGKIRNIIFTGKNSEPKFTIVKVGRISSLPHNVLPQNVDRDERHIFLTKEVTTVELKELVCVVYCYSWSSFTCSGPGTKLAEWLEMSPYHFYVQYEFPSIHVRSWSEKKEVNWQDLPVCRHCCSDNISFRKDLKQFRKVEAKNPMKTLDLFGGVGAFSRSLAEGSKCLKVTHAIEIGPSAAKTFKRNSPDTIVYNQCANTMLSYAVKSQEGHVVNVPTQLYDEKEKVPSPPKPGDIDAIVAGFPCQSHSDLNMYKKADDIKSNLIFNTLSWQDFLRPKISYYENVPGFLNFRLLSQQLDQHNVTGGIEKGGLKFTVRALLDMGYQVRYGMLEAGHYGTPQRRVRFFLIAALENYPLPELPQPSHQFNEAAGLTITLPSGKFCPIRTTEGVCPHPFVTIDDAISDLPRFDWEAPGARRRKDGEKRTVPVFVCDKKASTFCGFAPGTAPNYHHRAKTSYQIEARKNPTTNLQQFTKTLLPIKVKRVIAIPLKAGADYRHLPDDLVEWQTTNQMSSIARKNHKKDTTGPYGRLDKTRVFPTTVTNMDPTAKQCQVLNPYCKRMVTVRELARSQGFPDSFVFEAVDNSVITMHRQIGNAVPLPVGRALGRELGLSLYRKWKNGKDNAIIIDDSSEDDSDQDANAMQVDVVDDDIIDVTYLNRTA